MQLLSHRLCIRDIYPTDQEAYFQLYSHPDVAKYDDFEPITRDDLEVDMVRIAAYQSDSLNREYAVALLENNWMMGVLTLDMRRKYCNLGYHFHPAYQGKGYAIEAVQFFLSSQPDSFQSIVRLLIDPENAPSIRLAEKIGFLKIKSQKKKLVREWVYALKY